MGKLYVCTIEDAFSNRIGGYSIDSRMKSRLAVAALRDVVARRGAEGEDVASRIVHSDRGSQFRSRNWATREEFQIAIATWVERAYHRRRRQAALRRLTSIELETIMLCQPLGLPDQPVTYSCSSPERVMDRGVGEEQPTGPPVALQVNARARG
ncbi:hypothetical protein A6035_13935 [Dietzia lutea]|uniref:Integrase catalytic domain-containing protein n=1 Tax=Dietzia lutea TaxID=546160 RepID=A0A2S1R9W8_9ACTN|nr:hypothetical protein A6035_13935 [Dietzia lutea]